MGDGAPMVAAAKSTPEVRVISALPASPSSFAFLAAGQVTGLPITPIQPKTIVVGSQPQCEGANGASRGLAISWSWCPFEVIELLFELIHP